MVTKLREFFFEVLDTRERILLVYGLLLGAVFLASAGSSGNRELRRAEERRELAREVARELHLRVRELR